MTNYIPLRMVLKGKILNIQNKDSIYIIAVQGHMFGDIPFHIPMSMESSLPIPQAIINP